MKAILKYGFIVSIGLLGIVGCKDGDTIINQGGVPDDTQGYSFAIGNGESGEILKIENVVDIPIIMPEGSTKSDIVTIMAEVKSANGTITDVQTRTLGDDTYKVQLIKPTFTGEQCNNDAKVRLTPSIYDFGEKAVLEVSIINEKGVKSVANRTLWFCGTIVTNAGGELETKLSSNAGETKYLTVTGTMTETDFQFIRTSMPLLKGINLKETDLTELPGRAFAFYSSMGLTDNKVLQKVILPEKVQTIGQSAFAMCKALSILDLPESVTTLKEWIFEGTGALRTINIPLGVTVIPKGLFYSALGLEFIDIPASVTNIEADAFYQCSSLKRVDWTNNVTNIGDDAFNGCDLSSILIPSKLEHIGFRAFSINKNLKFPNNTVKLPEGFKTIAGSSFSLLNEGITIVDLPSTIESINSTSFEWEKVNQVICRATTPPEIVKLSDRENEYPPFYLLKAGCGLKYKPGADYSSWSSYFGTVSQID